MAEYCLLYIYLSIYIILCIYIICIIFFFGGGVKLWCVL